jgi:hypothetical protein
VMLAGATVLSDGKILGKTPGRFRLGVGQHQLVLRTDDGAQRTVSVSVVAGAPTLITVRMP